MPTTPPRTPIENLATIILWLSRAIDGHSTWGRLARPLAVLILDRLRTIKQRFDRLAARIRAGTYRPRRPAATPRPPTTRRPRQPNKLPQGFAWLVKLVPEAAAYGSQLQVLFAEPEMAALLAAAPGPMGRLLRPLCRMLAATPPKILAAPRRPRPVRPEPAPEPAAGPEAPPPPRRHPRTRLGFYKGVPPGPPFITRPRGPPPLPA